LQARRLLRPATAVLVAATLALLQAPQHAAAPPAIRGAHGMVVAPEGQAAQVGLDVLRAGGNAVDAAVAVGLALAVTHPDAGNLGGGGLLLYRTPAGRVHALDFRETAPRELRAEMFLDDDGRPVPGLSLEGGLAVAVPGTVAGLAEAHARWGTLEWSDLVAPAARLAEQGMIVSDWLAESMEQKRAVLAYDAEGRKVFLRDDRIPAAGDLLVQPDLARSLQRIAAAGPDGFYHGPTAEAIVRTVRRLGGVMDAQDLANYRSAIREPLEGRYRGHRVVSFPPPSSGGVVLLQILAMLERFDVAGAGYGSSASVHWMVEAERRAYADRSRWLGDPDFVANPLRGLLDAGYVAARAATIDPERATPSREVLPGDPPGAEPEDTCHASIADARGGAVAMTVTLNTSFGSGIVAEGTGILLNNEIDDFALAPGVPNTFGLLGGEHNAVRGGKRPLSSMTPTIVEPAQGGTRPLLVLGSPGGSKIITAVAQVLVNVLDHRMPLQEAVNAPRFHHQWQPDEITYEERAFPADVLQALARRGHRLAPSAESLGHVNAIGLDARGGWLGAADPRREGSARGY
jgi:gamma-glutamyltranspeptidase/glutathione hydrolase